MLGLFNNITTNKNMKSDIILANCENLNNFNPIYGCVGELDTSNKVKGLSSLKFTKNSDIEGYFTIDIVKNYNFSNYNNFNYNFYVANKSNIASVSTTLFSTTPFDYNNSFINFKGWQIVNGWNNFVIPFLTDFDKYGTASLGLITGIRFTVNLTVNNNTEVVNFDNVFVNK